VCLSTAMLHPPTESSAFRNCRFIAHSCPFPRLRLSTQVVGLGREHASVDQHSPRRLRELIACPCLRVPHRHAILPSQYPARRMSAPRTSVCYYCPAPIYLDPTLILSICWHGPHLVVAPTQLHRIELPELLAASTPRQRNEKKHHKLGMRSSATGGMFHRCLPTAHHATLRKDSCVISA
jgi:hypothetical protein